jgi:uncharacterized protein (DUF58 family)
MTAASIRPSAPAGTVRLFDEDFLRKLERLSILARQASIGQTQGERRSSKRGQSVEFADFRPYVAGDDIRRIDWNAYARLQRFFIKLFVEEEDLTVHILIDTSRSMDWGQPNKLGYALRAAGALGYIAMASLDRVTVTGLGDHTRGQEYHFPPHRGKGQALALFNFLQNLEASNGNHGTTLQPERQLQAYAAGTPFTGPALVISDLMQDGWKEGLHRLAAHGFEVTVLHILSPDEVKPQLEGDLKLVDYENETSVEITADYDLLERYRDELQAWQEGLERFCGARGIHYVPLETTLPLDELLFTWMRRQGVLK